MKAASTSASVGLRGNCGTSTGTPSSSLWRVWSTADCLEKYGLSTPLAQSAQRQELTRQVISILRNWGRYWAGEKQWQSFLNKSSLQHEVEESIIALDSLLEWMKDQSGQWDEPVIVVDVCCGKGVFSMLCSYVFQGDGRVGEIVMLDKAPIKWNHIQVVNETCEKEKRPRIQMWEQCNLHEYDDLLDRFQSLQGPLALIGIHLCKHLSPACIGLVNGLGPQKCPFLCLAPCCLPRLAVCKQLRNKNATRIINVPLYEAPNQRDSRRVAMERRDNVLGRGKGGRSMIPCYLCHSPHHNIRDCQLLPDEKEGRIAILRRAQAETVPCWRCGVVGHFRADCPSNQTSSKPVLITPPMVCMDVSNVLESDSPFDTYCGLLTETLQRKEVRLVETGLTNGTAQHDQPNNEQNWNGGRKSIYIIATQ